MLRKGPADGTGGTRPDRAALAALLAKHGDPFGVACLIGLVLAFFWREALLQGYLLFGDIVFFFEPAKALLHESLRAGRLPLWSPWIFAGYPVAAEGQIAAFYPPSLLISWLLPAPGAINWLVIVHLAWAGLSAYLLARLLGAPPFGAWLAGITYAFSGFLFAHIHHVSLLCAASWMPAVLYCVERAWRRGLRPSAVLAAVCWASAALCGHPQTLFHISLVVLFWVAWRWGASVRSQGRAAHVRAAAILTLTFVLGSALAAIQLLPTAALARAYPDAARGSLAYITSGALPVKALPGLLWPREVHLLYLGLVPLALAILAGARRRWWPLAGLAAAGLVLAVAHGNPAYHVLRFLPGFASFRAPGRYLSIFTFSAALLVALGWGTIARWRWLQSGRRLCVVGSIAAALTVSDLLPHARGLTPLVDRATLGAPNRVVDMLREDKGWWRAIIVPPVGITARWRQRGGSRGHGGAWPNVRALLLADVAQSYQIRIADGYAGAEDRSYARLLQVANAWAQVGNLELLSLLGVKYLALSQESLAGEGGLPAGPFVIFSNPAALPRVFAISHTVPVADRQEAHRQLTILARSRALRHKAVVWGGGGSGLSSPDARVELAVSEPRPERVLIQARADRDCLLVLNERYDPGWRVRVDGRRSHLLNVDVVLMGALLPRGEHQVEFLYRPPAFVIGRAVSLAALGLAAVLLAVPSLRRSSRE